jgi:phage terminase small subunit
VPNGTILTGILENDIDTQVSQNNDRFELVVQAPNRIAARLSKATFPASIVRAKFPDARKSRFNFERIRLSNGETYEFAGFLQSVTDENGKT